MTRNSKGTGVVEVIAVLAVLALLFPAIKPAWLDRDSKNAKQGQESTAKVEQTVAKVDDTGKKLSAEAAASVSKIVEANSVAPESPSKDFIAREAPVALSKLESPDPAALLAAEQRRVAVMEGRIQEADRLYDKALQHSKELQDERDTALRERDKALLERQAIDLKISEAAAAKLAAERQAARYLIVAVVVGALALWWKLTHFSGWQMSSIVNDVKAGQPALTAIDISASPLQQLVTRITRRLRE